MKTGSPSLHRGTTQSCTSPEDSLSSPPRPVREVIQVEDASEDEMDRLISGEPMFTSVPGRTAVDFARKKQEIEVDDSSLSMEDIACSDTEVSHTSFDAGEKLLSGSKLPAARTLLAKASAPSSDASGSDGDNSLGFSVEHNSDYLAPEGTITRRSDKSSVLHISMRKLRELTSFEVRYYNGAPESCPGHYSFSPFHAQVERNIVHIYNCQNAWVCSAGPAYGLNSSKIEATLPTSKFILGRSPILTEDWSGSVLVRLLQHFAALDSPVESSPFHYSQGPFKHWIHEDGSKWLTNRNGPIAKLPLYDSGWMSHLALPRRSRRVPLIRGLSRLTFLVKLTPAWTRLRSLLY
jgi:hypothetical protein